ncbi:MAG TPA: YhdP family protein [Rhodanobacteraceae bacterium]
MRARIQGVLRQDVALVLFGRRSMTRWRHHLRRARFAVTALVAAVLIAAALAMGVAQLLLPLASHYPDFVARQLSVRLHRPVRFTAMRSVWQPSGPLLTVTNLTLGPGHPGGQSITVPHAGLKFDFGAWLRPAQRWITLRLSGVDLRIEHDAAGWNVVGYAAAPGQSHASLQSLPVDLDLRDLRVDIVDKTGGHAWQLFAPHLRVVNVGNRIRFGGVIEQRGTTQQITIAGSRDPESRDGRLYVATRGLNLAAALFGLDLHGYAVRSGQADLRFWGTWRGGKLASVDAHYALRGLALAMPGGRAATVPSLAGALRATRVAGGWDAAWRGPGKAGADIDAAGGALLQLRGHPGAWRATLAARQVDLAPWLPLLALVPHAPAALAGWAQHAQPRVLVENAALAWQQHGGYDAVVRFSGLHAAAAGALPGLDVANGTLRADNAALSLELPTQAATVALPRVFRQPLVFSRLGGTLVAWRADGLWNIAADGMRFASGGLAGDAQARVVLLGRGQRPFLAAYLALQHGGVADAAHFWPYRSMSPKLIDWLNHALVAGTLTSGRVLLRGNLADWPFVNHAGRFEAAANINDATFDFADNWPRATGVDAALDFVDNRMAIDATQARARGVTATRTLATIPDLGHGVLGLDISGSGTGAQLMDFVLHSPVGAGAADVLKGLSVGGTGKFALQLSIPLHDAAKFSLAGKVDIANADVTAAKWNLALKGVTGPLVLAGKGFRADALAATFHGVPATLSLAVGSGVSDPGDIVEGGLDATLSAQALARDYPGLTGLVAHASGVAPWHVGVKVAAGQDGAPAVPSLTVRSSLAGIALDFPAPLDKPAASTLPLDVHLRLPPDGAPLTVSLGNVLRVRGRLADPARKSPMALAVKFGDALPATVPPSGMVVSGHTARLDVSGWVQQAIAGSADSGFPQLTRATVSTDAARVFGADLGALKFTYAAEADGAAIGLVGPAVQGTVVFPTRGLMARGITADLQRLYWPEPPPPKHPGPPPPPDARSPIAPAAIPPLHVEIADLRLGKVQLGATTFVSTPVPAAQSMRVGTFDSKGADFAIHAHGDWTGTRAASQSRFQIDIASHDFGKTLAEFGVTGLLAGGADSHLKIDGTWPGAPSSFSLAYLSGTLDIKVGQGRLLAVQPGLGRILGLLSLRELPSRLMLHFGDVFKSGFGFDDGSAHFTLTDGNAYTKDLVINAPAARIAMQGRTGFRARDFDLTVHVTPHVGVTLPVVGAVVAGPVGAAAGLLVQGLVGHGLNKAAESVYRVTGSWDKPKIANADSAPAPVASSGTTGAPPAPATSADAVSASSAALPAPASSTGAAAAAGGVAPATGGSAAVPASGASAG